MIRVISYIAFTLFLLMTGASVEAQYNSCSGSITGTNIADYPSTTQIGDGTTGYVKVCFTDNSMGTSKCMGTETHMRFYNGDGSNQVNLGAGPETCVTLTTNDGFAELSKYCWSGSADLSWTTVNAAGQNVCTTCSVDSDCAGNTTCDGTYCTGCATPGNTGNSAATGATSLNQCGTSFSTTLSGVTTYGQNTPAGNNDAAYNYNDMQDIDCNNSTSSSSGFGDDIGFTMEQGLWYKFCPQDAGTWEVSLTASNCDNGDGVQMAAFQGNPGNLHTKFFEFNYGMSTTQTMNITNTSECVYLVLDGYAGDVCDVSMSLSCTDCGCTLPIELLSFDGKAKKEGNLLEWKTATERGNSHFIVQKSRDGEDFKGFKKIEGAGTSTSMKKYSTLDPDPYPELTFYRLKQVDLDGDSSLSKIVAIKTPTREGFAIEGIYPNPSEGDINVKLRSGLPSGATFMVHDRTGRVVAKRERDLRKGSNLLELEFPELASGFYTLKVQRKGRKGGMAVKPFTIE